MKIVSLIITIISLIASLITLFAVWGTVSNFIFNFRNFRKGGLRITYYSGAYIIYSGFGKHLIYRSSKNEDDYTCYRGDNRLEMYEEIKPFKKWSVARKFDDIRVPQYPIQLL